MIIKFMLIKNLSWKNSLWCTVQYMISLGIQRSAGSLLTCEAMGMDIDSVQLPVPKYVLSSIAPVFCLTLCARLQWVCRQLQSREPDCTRWGSLFTSLSCNFLWCTRGWWAAVLSQVPGGLPVALHSVITVPWLMCQKCMCGHMHLPIRSLQ